MSQISWFVYVPQCIKAGEEVIITARRPAVNGNSDLQYIHPRTKGTRQSGITLTKWSIQTIFEETLTEDTARTLATALKAVGQKFRRDNHEAMEMIVADYWEAKANDSDADLFGSNVRWSVSAILKHCELKSGARDYFRPSPDYRTLNMDPPVILTPSQASVFQFALECYEAGQIEISLERISDLLGKTTNLIKKDTFNGRAKVYDRLFVEGSRRGLIRLNLPKKEN